MNDHFDFSSLLVIAITFVLFALALFTKGFTHDLILEAGVFLVSVKLILMAYKTSQTSSKTAQALEEITSLLQSVGADARSNE